MPLFFNANRLVAPSMEYVAWVDVMGTQASMSRSIKVTANFIFKLHTAALDAPRAAIRLYPVMDGFYASCSTQADILEFLRATFTAVAGEFNATAENKFRFAIRGGMAFGQVLHGQDVPRAASPALAGNVAYRDCLLLGLPMVQAHLCESNAPPFGVFVHESARASAPVGSEPLHHSWWRWDNATNAIVWNELTTSMINYFDWCALRSMRIGYDEDRIGQHRKMFSQYAA